MVTPPTPTRERILRAADQLAAETGLAAVSLDAIAARAGVSKGGLLYHFPSKARLMQALVEDHMALLDANLRAAAETAGPNAVIHCFLDHFLQERREHGCPPSGLLAAFAEDPQILAPVSEYQARFLDRIRSNATDPDLAVAAYLAVEALRAGELLNIVPLDEPSVVALVESLKARLRRT